MRDKNMSREQKRRLQRIRADITGALWVLVIALVSASTAVLCMGFIISGSGASQPPEPTPEVTASIQTPEPVEGVVKLEKIEPEIPQPEEDEGEETMGRVKLLESVPLDSELQAAIYGICGGDRDLFCFVMAIAEAESDFTPRLANGYCYGMMQINKRWHTGRMAELGVNDLLDPAQCVIVAVDYLRELDSLYGYPMYSHKILMAYNMGPGGARKTISKGIKTTEYSRKVLGTWEEYRAELEV